MQATKRRPLSDFVLLAILIVLCGLATINAKPIGDWVFLITYKPSVEVIKLANDAGMSEQGKRYFYRFNPQLVDEETIHQICGSHPLGCTEGTSLYLLQYRTQAEYQRTIVTAAHEMLHVAYDRLNYADRKTLNLDMEDQLKTYPNKTITEQLSGITADAYLNEAHSYIGSQQTELTSELERNYKLYFSDRQKTIAAYAASPEDQ